MKQQHQKHIFYVSCRKKWTWPPSTVIFVPALMSFRGHSQTTWTERHTYMVRKMSTQVHAGYIHGSSFVHIDMIFFVKFFKYAQNCSFQAKNTPFYHVRKCLLSCMNNYILLAQRSKTRYMSIVTEREGYKLIVHVDNTYMVY